MTLPRRLRLTRDAFEEATRKRATSEHFTLAWGPSRSGGLAAVISKKVAKRSVDRHLLKRRMLEIMRSHAHSGRSMVAYARKGAPTLSFKDMKRELESLLTRV
jgi:ribonuclease P protein component